MERIVTYCEAGFIDWLIDNLPKTTLADSLLINKNQGYQLLFDLIFNRSDLVLDLTDDELNAKSENNPFYDRLRRGFTDGYSIVNNLGEGFNTLFSENEFINVPNDAASLFLLNKYQINKLIQLGFFATKTTNNVTTDVKKLAINTMYYVNTNVKENTFPGWSFLKPLNEPLNAAIIADNYLLDKPASYTNNIFEIIKSILPDNLDIDFHLTLIVKRDLANGQVKFESIKTFINSLNKHYKVNLSIYLTSTHEPHDRDIITNYYWIHSGHGFDYFNERGNITHNTHLNYRAILSDDNNQNFTIVKKMLAYFKRLTNTAPDFTSEIFTNRLF